VSVHGDMVFAGAPFFDSPAEDAGVICSYVPTGLAVPRWKRDRCVTSVARPTAREGHFGASVDIGPATLAIGQPGENTVHVFERNSGAEPGWAHSDSLRIDGGEGTHDLRIGETLAVSGHSVVVGVPYGGTDEFAAGLAYVLSGTDGEWRVDQVLDPPNGEAFMRFGIDVAVSESVIAIAAQGAGIEPPSMGSVFVFEPFSGPGTPWVPVAELTAPSSIGALPSPRVVAADGDTIVACDHTWGGELGHFGACDVFRKDLGGWTFVQRLIASDSEPWMTFGYDVAIDEDTILVGAPYWGHGSDRFQARAYVFERNADGAWIETTQLGRSEESRYDHIGRSVALDGDIAALGAPRAGDPKASGLVAVYRRFGGAGGRWNRIAEFSDPTPEEGAEFGSSIAVHGQEILVGTPFDSEQGSEAGAAALFVRQLVREPGERRLP